MKHYVLNLTKKCQNNCVFCSFKYPPVAGYTFDSINYKKFLYDEKVKDSIVSLGGGEPTLNNNLLAILKIFKSRNNYVELITNGQKLSDLQYCKSLLQAGMDRFCISLHSINSKMHVFLTSNKDSFKQTLAGILNLVKLKKQYDFDLNIVFVLNSYNLKDLYKTLKFLNRLGKLNMQINLAHTGKEEILLNLSRIKSELEKFDLQKLNNLNIHLYGFAFCFLPKAWRKFVVDFKNDDKMIIHKNKFYNHLKLVKVAKVKYPACKNCIYDKRCEGTWRSYIKANKYKNLKPILNAD